LAGLFFPNRVTCHPFLSVANFRQRFEERIDRAFIAVSRELWRNSGVHYFVKKSPHRKLAYSRAFDEKRNAGAFFERVAVVIFGQDWTPVDGRPILAIKPEDYAIGEFDFRLLGGMGVDVIDRDHADLKIDGEPAFFWLLGELAHTVAPVFAWEYCLEIRGYRKTDFGELASNWRDSRGRYLFPAWGHVDLLNDYTKRRAAFYVRLLESRVGPLAEEKNNE
jgi:hypothetical protein